MRHDGLRRHLHQQALPDWKLDDSAGQGVEAAYPIRDKIKTVAHLITGITPANRRPQRKRHTRGSDRIGWPSTSRQRRLLPVCFGVRIPDAFRNTCSTYAAEKRCEHARTGKACFRSPTVLRR